MPRKAKSQSKSKAKRRKARKRSFKKKTYTVSAGRSLSLSVPRGLAPSPDALFPRTFKCVLHTRRVSTLDPGNSPQTASTLEVNLNNAGKPFSAGSAYAYGVDPGAINTTIYEPGSTNRDPLNLFNYYKTAYVIHTVVRCAFVSAGSSNINMVPSIVGFTPAVNGDANIARSFALLDETGTDPRGNVNFEEIPGVMRRLLNDSINRRTVTLQRGYGIKRNVGAHNAFVGNTEYATMWNYSTNTISPPVYKTKMAIVQKDLASSLDPMSTTWAVDVYQTVIFTDKKTQIRTINATPDP